ncbi:MAG: hypothetical protein JWR83_543 [Aeromicrobium sp.]|nr:hypothetical protein [Aeromicrobium sp.]
MLRGTRAVTAAAAIGVLAVVLAALAVLRANSNSPEPGYPFVEGAKSDSPGAAALVDPANKDVVWSDITSIPSIRPLPKNAVGDRPSFYDDGSGCQVEPGDPVPKVCTSGDQNAQKTLMLVGDSKIGQWQTAFSDIGRRDNWRLLTTTKSTCAFTSRLLMTAGKAQSDCQEWGRATLKDILRVKPDVVVTSQVRDTALPDGKTASQDRTQEAMIRGLHTYWTQLQDAGIRVVVLLDNPMPTTHPVYQCVEDNPRNLSKCAYTLARAYPGSSAPMQLKAAAATPGVRVIDMTPTLCPDDGRCPGVIGNVLVYRAGSHLTRTFVVSAEGQLAARLAQATDGNFGG